MPRFFRASSWDSEELLNYWIKTSVSRYPLIKFNGRPLLIGDGIKIAKESSKTPGVKSLHQDSENSGRGEYISGHHFGYAGLLVGRPEKTFCLPLQGQIHEGVGARRHDIKIGGEPTMVTRMANLVIRTAEQTGFPCYVTLDACFSTGPAFLTFGEAVNDNGEQSVHLITRAKNNYVGYLVPEDSLLGKYEGWLRTASSDCPSEGVVRSVIQAEFLSSLGKVPADRTLRMIRGRGRETSSDIAA
ncbi:Uncharacterized protein dnm_092310 [Desulfonema magnum]|uniref:Transposase IS701-like DDE domain-containing protein n=2 Tax=Desulfonema magnum TaxID=45655 RepID=A0A975GTJ2_9BACT|nr:Uncharacterized protein dnm_092310 [Desulfonema magnum]